jgi:hypothetical protein
MFVKKESNVIRLKSKNVYRKVKKTQQQQQQQNNKQTNVQSTYLPLRLTTKIVKVCVLIVQNACQKYFFFLFS